jgi:NDP-sugar pyrophosphorylase family protein
MIVAAGLGTRLKPLTDLRPKPTVPIRGVPMIAYTLALLAKHGVREVVVNAHYMPEQLIETTRRVCPEGLALQFSVEKELLDTGGGIRKVADFLRASDPCLIVGGDMLLDFDLSALIETHRRRADAFTLLLREADPRSAQFGTIGVDGQGCLRRIGDRIDLGGAVRSGVYTWANVVSAAALDTLPDRPIFSHLDDWLAPLAAAGARNIRAEIASHDECVWEPVGTPQEYLAANLQPPRLSYLGEMKTAPLPDREDGLVVGAGASIEPGARLQRAVVWDGERVGRGVEARDGVFAGGRFHAFGDAAASGEPA